MIRNPVPWPDGARCAACLTLDMDAESILYLAHPREAHSMVSTSSMLRYGPDVAVPRILDVYSALPSITGKLELEYEGEMRGADFVARELIRAAVAKTFDAYFEGVDMQQIVQWFDLGGEIKFGEGAAAAELSEGLKKIQGLPEKIERLGVKPKEPVELKVSAAEFVLEGLHAHKRIGRSEERVFTAGEKPVRREQSYSREEPPTPRPPRRPYN